MLITGKNLPFDNPVPSNPPIRVAIIRIKNTLALAEFEISEAMVKDLKENMEVLGEPYFLPFDQQGNLL